MQTKLHRWVQQEEEGPSLRFFSSPSAAMHSGLSWQLREVLLKLNGCCCCFRQLLSTAHKGQLSSMLTLRASSLLWWKCLESRNEKKRTNPSIPKLHLLTLCAFKEKDLDFFYFSSIFGFQSCVWSRKTLVLHFDISLVSCGENIEKVCDFSSFQGFLSLMIEKVIFSLKK